MWKNDEEWVAQVPELIKQAPLWNFKVYRLAFVIGHRLQLTDDIISGLVTASEQQRNL